MRLVVLGTAVVLAAGVAASFAANAGLCFQEMRRLDDAKYYRSAVDIVIHDPVDGVIEYFPGGSVAKAVHSQKYSNADEFLSEFPNCCRFVLPNSGDGDGLGIGFLERVAGIRVVEVHYIERYFDEGKQKTSETTAKVAVTSCGKGLPLR
jgi:hypothetical protein